MTGGGSWLGYEVTRRRMSLWRASGGALAARLGGRRMPASVAAATRLAPRRAVARAPEEDVAEPLQVPGMNDAAARWLFLGELPPGTQPFLGGQPTGVPTSASARRAAHAAQGGGVRRGRVEEGPAVARTPDVTDASPPPAAEPAGPRALDALLADPEPVGDQPSATPAPVRARRLARAPASEPSSSTPPAVPQRPTRTSAEAVQRSDRPTVARATTKSRPIPSADEAQASAPASDSSAASPQLPPPSSPPTTEAAQSSDRPTIARASTSGTTTSEPVRSTDEARPPVEPPDAPTQRVVARTSSTSETPRAEAKTTSQPRPIADEPRPAVESPAAPTQRAVARTSTTSDTPPAEAESTSQPIPSTDEPRPAVVPPDPPAQRAVARTSTTRETPPAARAGDHAAGVPLPSIDQRRPAVELPDAPAQRVVARASTTGKTPPATRAGDDTTSQPALSTDEPQLAAEPSNAPAQGVVARTSTTSEPPAAAPDTPARSTPEPRTSGRDRATKTPAAAVSRSSQAPKTRARSDDAGASASVGEQAPTGTVRRSERPTVARASTRGASAGRTPRAAADQAEIGERTGSSDGPARVTPRTPTTSETQSLARASSSDDVASEPRAGTDVPEPRDEARSEVDRADAERPGPTDTRSQRVVARASTPGETRSLARAQAERPVADEARSDAPAQRAEPRAPTNIETPSLARAPAREETASEAGTVSPVAADEARPTAARVSRSAADRQATSDRPRATRVAARAATTGGKASVARAAGDTPVAADDARPDIEASASPGQRVVARESMTSEPPASAPADPKPPSPSRAVAREPDVQTRGREGAAAGPEETGTPRRAVARTSDGPDAAPSLPEPTPSRGALMRLRTAPAMGDAPVATPSGPEATSSDRPQPARAAAPAPEGATPPLRDRRAVARTPASGDVVQPAATGERSDPAPLARRADGSKEATAIARASARVEPALEPARRAPADARPAATPTRHPVRSAGESPAIARASAAVEPAREATRSTRRASAGTPPAASLAPQPVRPADGSPTIARTSAAVEAAGEAARSTRGGSADAPPVATSSRQPVRSIGESAAIARTSSPGGDARGDAPKLAELMREPVEPAREPAVSARPAPAVARALIAEPSRVVDRPVAVPRADTASPLARAPSSGSRRSPARLRPMSRKRAAEPEPARSSPPAVNGGAALARRIDARPSAATDPARLAVRSGGTLVAAPDGRASVVFSSTGGQPAGSASATTTATTPSPLPLPTPAPAPAPAAPAIDVDDLYDQIAARLRRELLLDRERAGEMP